MLVFTLHETLGQIDKHLGTFLRLEYITTVCRMELYLGTATANFELVVENFSLLQRLHCSIPQVEISSTSLIGLPKCALRSLGGTFLIVSAFFSFLSKATVKICFTVFYNK